jgi:glyoxylase-like metal-dependent hydrolase (beta-lactamase superfamily II)
MEIYHLNCGSLYARVPKVHAIIYCLLVAGRDGLVLVDTGFGLGDYARPSLMMNAFLWLMGSPRDPAETAAHQVDLLGYQREDVAHIVFTHMHLDHAGGLPDFPHAQIHVFARELEAVRRPHGLLERGYDRTHFAHGPNWVLYDRVDGDWFGFESIDVDAGPDLEIKLIPLPGHTRGHCGVAVKTRRGWLFQCGDAASPMHPATDLHARGGPYPLGRVFPDWLAQRALGPHVPRLEGLQRAHGDEVEIISSHDIFSFNQFREGVREI